MTKGRAALPARVVAGQTFFITVGGPTAHDFSGRNIFRKGPLTPQISPLRSFGAPVEMTKGRTALPARVVAGQTFFITVGGQRPMTSPVEKHFQERIADTADLSTTLLRSSGRDDKGEGTMARKQCSVTLPSQFAPFHIPTQTGSERVLGRSPIKGLSFL